MQMKLDEARARPRPNSPLKNSRWRRCGERGKSPRRPNTLRPWLFLRLTSVLFEQPTKNDCNNGLLSTPDTSATCNLPLGALRRSRSTRASGSVAQRLAVLPPSRCLRRLVVTESSHKRSGRTRRVVFAGMLNPFLWGAVLGYNGTHCHSRIVWRVKTDARPVAPLSYGFPATDEYPPSPRCTLASGTASGFQAHDPVRKEHR